MKNFLTYIHCSIIVNLSHRISILLLILILSSSTFSVSFFNLPPRGKFFSSKTDELFVHSNKVFEFSIFSLISFNNDVVDNHQREREKNWKMANLRKCDFFLPSKKRILKLVELTREQFSSLKWILFCVD